MTGKRASAEISNYFNSPATGPQPPAGMQVHGMAMMKAEAEMAMVTWGRKRMTVGNVHHARREVDESPPETTAEEVKREEVTAPTAIHEAEEDMVPNITRFTTQLVL